MKNISIGGDFYKDDISAVLKLILVMLVIGFIYIFYNNLNNNIK
jgi:hypothetical protein